MTLQWSAIFVGGLAVGISIVALLVVPQGREPLLLLLGIAGVAFGLWAIIDIVDAYARIDMTLAALSLSLGSVGGGYALASALLPYLTVRGKIPALPDEVEDRGLGPLVLLLAQIEPERYRPSAITQELHRLAGAGLPEATLGIAPFLYAAQKARYRALGGSSPSAGQARSTAEQLEAELRGTVGSVRLVSSVGRDTLDRAVVHAACQGYRTLVVAALSIGESYALDRAKSLVDTLRPESHGLRVIYTPPLWSSDGLCEQVSEIVWNARDEPDTTAVALVLHGQPEAWQKSHASFDVHENSFANRIRATLIERGLRQENIRLCYAEWRNPDITETVRHLAALGCSRVLICPACFPFESSVTILDMPVAVRQARVDAHVSTVILGAWGDGRGLVDVLATTARAALHESE